MALADAKSIEDVYLRLTTPSNSDEESISNIDSMRLSD
jgi:hypothetical protein